MTSLAGSLLLLFEDSFVPPIIVSDDENNLFRSARSSSSTFAPSVRAKNHYNSPINHPRIMQDHCNEDEYQNKDRQNPERANI